MLKKYYKKIITTILTWQAKHVIRRFKPTIIAVTGNVGKTSTKDAIFFALKPYGHVRRSEKSFNSDTGVPLSILGLPNGWNNPIIWASNILHGFRILLLDKEYPKYLVLEIGADHPGDISDIAKWLKPDISVFTRFPDVPVHVEFFKDVDAVINEKKSLAQYTKIEGALILNADDAKVMELSNLDERKTYTYGVKNSADIKIEKTTFHKTDTHISGSETEILFHDKHFTLVLPHIVSHGHIVSALLSILIVDVLGFPIEEAFIALREYRTPPGRFSLIDGMNDTLIIDDTYNSSPLAVEHALDILSAMPTKAKKIVVLGDMMELGEFTKREHEKIGEKVVGIADVLITVGNRAESIYNTALVHGFNKKHAYVLYHADDVEKIILPYMKSGAIVLFKGSQSVRLEKAVYACMAHPEDAKKLLVRQDSEWKKR